MTKMKKVLCILTSAVCALGVFFPTTALFTASAEDAEEFGIFKYYRMDSDNDGTDDCIEIVSCDKSVVSVDIPKEIEGLPVTSIGQSTFYDCTNLEEVTIPDSVTRIEQSAFFNCTNLKSINIPDGVTRIGDSAFSFCTSLESVYISDIAAWCGIEFSSNPLWESANLYLNGELVTNLVIPDSVTSIESGAFSGYKSLKSITIPDSVTSIGDRAFSDCTSLETITIGSGVTSIGSNAFYGCTSLKSLTIPDSVTSIGEWAFHGCTSLKSLTIGNSVSSIGINAFQSCESLTNVDILDGVTSIGEAAFNCCRSLESITIPESVTSIGSEAFNHCEGLKSITILNPDCEILGGIWTIADGDTVCELGGIIYYGAGFKNGTIYGYSGSTAQAYAKEYDKNFKALDSTTGDISGNGEIDLYDVIEIAKFLIHKVDFSEDEMKIADFNEDGIVDLYDAIDIAKYILEHREK